jgi:ubiquitin carboxyl-terminal hydrolase 9/13
VNGAPVDALQPVGAVAIPRKHNADEGSVERPKSVHASPGLGLSVSVSVSPLSAPTSSANIVSAGTNIKHAKRKLSLTAPILGFGKRDKEKDKQKDKGSDRERLINLFSPSPTPKA